MAGIHLGFRPFVFPYRPGGVYAVVFFTAASMSSAVSRTVVLLVTPPLAAQRDRCRGHRSGIRQVGNDEYIVIAERVVERLDAAPEALNRRLCGCPALRPPILQQTFRTFGCIRDR